MNDEQRAAGSRGDAPPQANSLEADVLTGLLRSLVKEAVEQEKRTKPAGFGLQGGAAHPKKREIDIVEYFYRVLASLHYVLIAAVVCAVLAGVYASARVTTMYTATSKLYVVDAANSAVISISDLQLGNYLTKDYQEVFYTWEVLEMVRQELGLTYSYSQMQNMVSVTNPENTRILYITVVNDSPQLAIDMANAFATAARQFILETMETAEPNIFSIALIPGALVNTTRTSTILMGFLLGSVLALGIILLRLLLDDKPRTPEDISRHAGIPTMAVIPTTGDKKALKNALKRRRR